MNSLPRFVGFSVLLLLAFLTAALSAPRWLRWQMQLSRAEAINARKIQLAAVLHAGPRPVSQPDEAYQRELGTLVGGSVAIFGGGVPVPPPPSDPNLISFDHPTENGGASFTVRVTFAVPPAIRLLAVYQRATVGLLLFGAALIWVVAFLTLLARRTTGVESAGTTRSPWQRTQVEIGSLEHFVKTSVAQSEALDHERDVRRRAEEDALLKQSLLNQSLEERIGLGRDLHDGIIQSLYAVGLTLESARGLAKTNPAEADKRLEQCREGLNNTIREVRTYITGLVPENLRKTGFTQTLEGLCTELAAGRDVSFDIKVDDETTALLTGEQTTEALQIVREAVSNAIRHGGASLVTLRLHKSDNEICLLVQDNGTGFDAALRREGGHGLGNMHARAKRVGGTTTVTSQPSAGTRVVVMLTLSPSIPA